MAFCATKEAEEVISFYRDKLNLNIIKIDARERFLGKLAGVTEPEQKRKIIGAEFVHVFEEEAKSLAALIGFCRAPSTRM